jgi:hypothetical protein
LQATQGRRALQNEEGADVTLSVKSLLDLEAANNSDEFNLQPCILESQKPEIESSQSIISHWQAPAVAALLREKIFNETGMLGAEASLRVVLNAGESVPVIGKIFSILKEIKQSVDVYINAEEECARLSVWCQTITACLGNLAKDCKIDRQCAELLTAVHKPLEEFSELIHNRLKISMGVVGRMFAFGTAPGFKEKSALVQGKLKKAIDALKLQLMVETRKDLEKVLDRTELLLNMDIKMDEILEQVKGLDTKIDKIDSKVDFLLQEKRKQTVKEIKQNTHSKTMMSLMIPATKLKLEDTPFAEGGSCKVYRAQYSMQTVAAKVQIIHGGDVKQFRMVLERFEKEIGLLGQLFHPHVLRVWGACTDQPGSLIMVTEYAEVEYSLS